MSGVPVCYTTAYVRAGRVRFEIRHVARLRRDARGLGLGELDPDACREALRLCAREAFGDGEGVVRLEARRSPSGDPTLHTVPRGLGDDPATWRAVCSSIRHPGPAPSPGAKREPPDALLRARRLAEEQGAHEALLFDAGGLLVEGSHSNLVVVDERGQATTPPLARGGVAGIGLEVARQGCAALRERDVGRDELRGARELLALNAVRGVRPVTSLDGRPVGDGTPGPWSKRLAEALAAEEGPLCWAGREEGG